MRVIRNPEHVPQRMRKEKNPERIAAPGRISKERGKVSPANSYPTSSLSYGLRDPGIQVGQLQTPPYKSAGPLAVLDIESNAVSRGPQISQDFIVRHAAFPSLVNIVFREFAPEESE
jgi:hypothetical protein